MTSSEPIDPALQPLVDLAAADLAGRLGVARSAIEVVSAQAVEWPDGSLGCPRPGMAYPQVMVDGTRIQLSVAGTVYDYHSGGTRPPFLCENGR